MSDNASNPYASPESSPADDRLRRPVGTIVIAAVLMLFALILAAGGMMRYSRISWSGVPLRFLLNHIQLTVMVLSLAEVLCVAVWQQPA